MTNSIQFKLFAPYNISATLIGCFSNWQEIPLEKDDTGYFRTSVDLADGVYQYKFRVKSKSWSHQPDEWVEINDPYVTEIDAAQCGVLRIKDGEKIVDDYVWQHDDQPLPSDRSLIIYELLVADFTGDAGGRYKDVIDKLDYLCSLGINAIELMPVNKNPGDYSWGYTPSYFFAPEPRYGSTADLKKLIDECHSRGIRVIFDQLYNHSSEESPLLHIDRDYWYYHGHHHPEDEYYWGPEFNYEYFDEKLNIHPAREFMGDVVRFWIQEYHIDGVRLDALRQLDNTDFLHWLTQKAKSTAEPKAFYTIGEYAPEKIEMVSPPGPIDGCWHYSFFHFLRQHLWGEIDFEQLKDALNLKRQGYPAETTKAINFLCNHDTNRPLVYLGERDITGEAAFKRVKLGVALLTTAVGVPMFWMGEEFGESAPKQGATEQSKLEWSLLDNDSNRSLFEYYKNLIALRKENSALVTANIEFFHENTEDKVIAYQRWTDDGSRVVVVANFSDQFLGDYQIPNFPEEGIWHECTKNYRVESSDKQLKIDLDSWEAQVFVL